MPAPAHAGTAVGASNKEQRPPPIRVGGPARRGDAAIATDDARINDRIRARQVRLIGADGSQLGVKPLPEALSAAREVGLDLVEVAANADPPVCKIMDYGKYKYEQDQRRKESRRKATSVVIKEMKFRPKIDGHDYETKMKHVERFLAEGSKVKLTIMFRGREMAHPELGRRILNRVAEQVAELATVESSPRQDGRNMTMVLNPTRRPKGKGQGATKGAPKSGDHVDDHNESEGTPGESPAQATA
jgi:translation initiation factor IF-3